MSTAFAVDLVDRSAAAVAAAPARPVGTPLVRPAPPLRGAPAAAPAAAPRARPRVAAAVVVLGGVACVIAAQLVLSVGTADGAYRLAALQQRSVELTRQQQVQQEALGALAAPQQLAERAAALGMVQSGSPAYLDARTGKVLGSAKPATGPVQRPGDVVR